MTDNDRYAASMNVQANRRGPRLGILWSFLTILGTSPGACGLTRAVCSNDVRREAPSPNGRWRAVILERSCGTLSSPQMGVSVFEPSQAPGSEYPNVFNVTYSGLHPEETEAVLTSVSVRWTDDSSISIQHDARATILYQVTRMWGISIRYRELPVIR
jgi:hypothetical protein